MGTVTKTIGSAGGRDYSLPQAWEDALPTNLVTDANNQVGLLYPDSEFVLTGAKVLDIAGETTSTAYNITLKAAVGKAFYDNANRASNRLTYDPANGVALRSNIGYAAIITCSADYTVFDGLQIKATNSSASGIGGGNNGTISNCIAYSPNTGIGTGHSNGRIINCLIITDSNASTIAMGLYYGAKAYNCTLVRPSNRTPAGYTSSSSYATATIKNCALFGYTGFQNNYTSDGHNVTDMATCPGTVGNIVNAVYANQFVNPSTASGLEDFRVKAGSDLIGAGIRDATDTSDLDIIKQARSTTAPTVGAWEYIVAGGTAYTKTIAAISASAAKRTNKIGKPSKATTTELASFKRAAGRKVAAAIITTATLKRLIKKTAKAAEPTTAILNKMKAKLQILAAASTSTTRTIKTIKATKKATSASASTNSQRKALRRTILVASSTIARFSKRLGRRVAASSASNTILSRIKSKMVGLSTLSASVAKKAIQIRASKKATSATFGAFQIKRGLKRTIAALGTLIARRTIKLGLTKKATSTSTSTLGRIKAKLVSLSATIGSIAKKSIQIRARKAVTSNTLASMGRIISASVRNLTITMLATSSSLAKRIAQIRLTRKATANSASALTRIKAKLILLAASSATIARTAKALRKKIASIQASTATFRRKINVRRVVFQLSLSTMSRTLPFKKTMAAIAGSTGRMSRRAGKVMRAISTSWLWAFLAKTVNTNPDRVNKNETLTLKAHNREITVDRKTKTITTTPKIKTFTYRGKQMYTFSPKRPASVPVLSFNVAPELAVGEVVTGASASISLKSGVVDPNMGTMLVGGATFTGTTVSAKISGGLNGNYYYITYLVTTTYQTIEIQAVLFVSTGAM